MTKTFAIAALAVRAAFRSRLFITLAIVLLVVIVGLPMTIKGDGTAEGQVRILLYYTMGLASVILGISTLWASCAAISSDIEDKHIQLTVAKPVHRFQIWLGKWIGLLVINAILLTVTGVAIYAFLRHYAHSAELSAKDRIALGSDLLVGRRLVAPAEESVDDDVSARMEKMNREGKIPTNAPLSQVIATLKKSVMIERCVVAPDQTKRWEFTVPPRPKWRNVDTVTLRYRLSLMFRDRKGVSGVWTIGAAEGPDSFRSEIKGNLNGSHTIEVPASALPPGKTVTVMFANADRTVSGTAVFDPDMPVEMLIRESSFESNLARALVVILCQLGLVAAIGLTAGSLFSFPVATFAAVALVSISVAGGYFTVASSARYASVSDEKDEVTVLRAMSESVLKRLEVVIAPATELAPLGLVSDGILVSWQFTGRAVLLLLIVYPGFFWLFGSYFLNRRELALPVT